mgnify:FL=1
MEEKASQMEQTYAEGKNVESELESVSRQIESAEKVLQEFEKVAEEAKAAGLDVSSQHEGFVEALQKEKDRLAALQARQAELQTKVNELSADTGVMGRIQEEAIKENIERDALEEVRKKETAEKDARESEKINKALELAEGHYQLMEKELAEAENLLNEFELADDAKKSKMVLETRYKISDIFLADATIAANLRHASDKWPLPPEISNALQRLEDMKSKLKDIKERLLDKWRTIKEDYEKRNSELVGK